jgi:hypothetical protein
MTTLLSAKKRRKSIYIILTLALVLLSRSDHVPFQYQVF